MATDIINKLNQSLDELERSIGIAKKSLFASQPVPLDVVRRIQSYEDIISKQRLLSSRLVNLIHNNQWDEVTRHVKLINGFSAMIHEDASSLLKNMSLKASTSECVAAPAALM